jgi:hypothetical protein
MAVSFVVAMPVEPFQNSAYGGTTWLVNSCGVVYAFLTLSFTLQAMLTPPVLFLLPGPGSILRQKAAAPGAPQSVIAVPKKSSTYFVMGIAFAGAIPLLWWPAVRWWAASRGLCPEIFNLSRRVDFFRIDYIQDCQRYFVCFSAFAAAWAGITAGALRLQSARAATAASSSEELRSFQSFYWACVLSWAAMYRVGITLPSLLTGRTQEWEGFSMFGFSAMAVSSAWTLVFVRSLWKARPANLLGAVLWPYGASFLISVLTALTFFWAPLYAGAMLAIPFLTLNAFGLIWALFVGSWRWRALKQERMPTTIRAGPIGAISAPALPGLRTFELMGIIFAGLLVVAAVSGLLMAYVVLHRNNSPRQSPFPRSAVELHVGVEARLHVEGPTNAEERFTTESTGGTETGGEKEIRKLKIGAARDRGAAWQLLGGKRRIGRPCLPSCPKQVRAL